jgi:hypothetical protein
MVGAVQRWIPLRASRLVMANDGRGVGVRGHFGGKGLEPQPMGAGSRLDPTGGPGRLRSDLCRRLDSISKMVLSWT